MRRMGAGILLLAAVLWVNNCAWADGSGNKPPVKGPAEAAAAASKKLEDNALALVDPSCPLALDWGKLGSGVSLEIINKSAKPVTVKAEPLILICDAPCNAVALDVSPKQKTLGSYQTATFILRRPDQAGPGNQQGVLTLGDVSGVAAPFRQVVWVRPLAAQIVARLYRGTPCGGCFGDGSKERSLVFAGGVANEKLFALLRNDAGNQLFSYWVANGSAVEFGDAPSAGAYKGEASWGPASAKTTIGVTAVVADRVVYPLIVILVGIGLVYAVNVTWVCCGSL